MQGSISISIDSRTIQTGDVFIPIKGSNFDGHDFIPEVLAKGGHILDVDLSSFAKQQRELFDIPLIAITGSSGKTTTKDRLAALLKTKFKTLKTKENQNNEVGVPLTLLNLCQFKCNSKSKDAQVQVSKGDFEVAVIELAMRAEGEIEYLTKIVQPTHVVITNIGVAHLGRLGSREAIKQAKCEILFPTNYSQKAFLNKRDDYFAEVSNLAQERGWKVIPYDEDPLPEMALEFGIDPAIVNTLVVDYSSQRMETISANGYTILNDTYNANPDSVRWALNKLRGHSGRKIAVLGDMLELGEDEIKYHQNIDISGLDKVFTFGPRYLKSGLSQNSHVDKNLLLAHLKSQIQPGDTILIKGSRGMKMEEVVEKLK